MSVGLRARGLPRPGRTSSRAVALTLLAQASCTTIGPTVTVSPGSGHSPARFEAERRDCMAATDRVLQPRMNALNASATSLRQVADNNRLIQQAYDDGFSDCMAARGNLPAPGAARSVTMPIGSAPQPSGTGTRSADQGPAAAAFERWFTTRRSGCFNARAQPAHCTLATNMEGYALSYGDAGHGRDADVLALALILEDPTGNGDVPLVGYLRGEGGSYWFVREYKDLRAFGIVPGTAVRFVPGGISFTAVTHRDDEDRSSRTGRTPMTLPVE